MGLTQWETLCGLFFCFFEKIVVPILTSGGYVGLSLAVLLAQHHQVTAVDIVPEKVELINSKKSPIQDEYIEKYLAEKELNLTATLDAKEAYSDADFVVIAAPTNYDSKKNFFDTSAVEAVIKLVIEYNPEAIMVIKSTIPVIKRIHWDRLLIKYNDQNGCTEDNLRDFLDLPYSNKIFFTCKDWNIADSRIVKIHQFKEKRNVLASLEPFDKCKEVDIPYLLNNLK